MDPNDVADTVRRAADGDRAAWDDIVESFSGLVWSIAIAHRLSSADAAEVLQTTWLRLLENITRLRQPERLGGWLATTARNESVRVLREHRREIVTDDHDRFGEDLASGPTPEEIYIERDGDRELWRAFTQLPERCRTLLQLVVVVAPPYTEVAAALDLPIGSIGPTRARCLRRLRRLLLSVDAGGRTGER